MGPRKNAPKMHFTRSNGFVPTKHPNSRTPNALKGIRGLAFGGFVGTQAFKHIQSACLRGFWMAWGRPLMLMMLPFLGPKRLPKPKNTCLQRFLKVFRRQNACIECFYGPQTNPTDAPDADARARARRRGGGGRGGEGRRKRDREKERTKTREREDSAKVQGFVLWGAGAGPCR